MGAAWKPEDIKLFMELFQDNGPRYSNPGWHSGYNEVVVNSRSVNDNLPQAIQAFFVPEGGNMYTDLGYGRVVDVRKAHKNFLRTYGLSAYQVPLLTLRPGNWNTPFALMH